MVETNGTNETVDLPDYLSKDFFKKSIENGLQIKNVEIDDLKISLGSVPGDNYTSTIYRTAVKYHLPNGPSTQVNLIVKSIKKVDTRQLLDDLQVFEREVEIYSEVLPRIEKLYKNVETFSPKLFHSEVIQPYQVLVFEDLKAKSFVVAERTKFLNEEYSKMVLRKLGRFHAASLVLLDQEPELFRNFNVGFFHESFFDKDELKLMFEGGLSQAVDFIATWEGCEKIAEKLRHVLKNLREYYVKYNTTKPDEIQVLNHSDLWITNMMFKVENGNLTDMNFLDFQCSTNDSIGMDLNRFLYCAINFDVLNTKREELLKEYYNSFRLGLEELSHHTIPSWEEVFNEFKRKEFFGLLVVISITSIVCLDKEILKDTDFESMFKEGELEKKRAISFMSPKYQNHLKKMLKRLDAAGILD